MRPLLRLDRIYVRGFTVEAPVVHLGEPWSHILTMPHYRPIWFRYR